MLFWKYIFKLLKENVQKVSRPICYCGLIVTYLQVYHEKSQYNFSLLAFWIPEREQLSKCVFTLSDRSWAWRLNYIDLANWSDLFFNKSHWKWAIEFMIYMTGDTIIQICRNFAKKSNKLYHAPGLL